MTENDLLARLQTALGVNATIGYLVGFRPPDGSA